MKNCKRLIEVDFPIRRVSGFARDEKNLRSGHPWHLHIWWARRPWGACRAVALASLLPAPSDEQCPRDFVRRAAELLSPLGFRSDNDSRQSVQAALLGYVGEFARWQAGADRLWRETARKLIRAAYPTTPHVVDPFAGYGAIPGESARLGCESFASDLNPVALLCLRILLEAVPRHGETLIQRFHEGADFVRVEAERRLSIYYPKRKGRHVIAWLWARTVRCEGPACGATIPLISQTTLAKGKHKAWIEITSEQSTKDVNISIKTGRSVPRNLLKTAGGGHAVCPVCGFTTNKEQVKAQGKEGAIGSRLYGVAVPVGTHEGKQYSEPSREELDAFDRAAEAWKQMAGSDPEKEVREPFVLTYGLHVPPHYGISTWGDLFSPRQKLALHTIGEILSDYGKKLTNEGVKSDIVRDAVSALALSIGNMIHYNTNTSTWLAEHMISCFITGNAITMRWDWAEANPLVADYVGGLDFTFKQSEDALVSAIGLDNTTTTVTWADARRHPLPDDSADLFFTDPPYYDVVPYADLSDLSYVWLKRYVHRFQPDLFAEQLTPKKDQIVVNPYSVDDGRGDQSPERYQDLMTQAFQEGCRILKPGGIGCIVFAHKGTSAWEALLGSIIEAGFVVTASWPIDTERAARMRANKSAALGSSVHIVVRPRENPSGAIRIDSIGDWRDILSELPRKIRSWMGRLLQEGIVGADAIFACLGPALEVYSRYPRVEKANGDQVFLREYLEYVWATISREALATIFEEADASGFEADARLTAIWLWTLRTEENGFEDEQDVGRPEGPVRKVNEGYPLEYDAVNNIAKGLGIHLEDLETVVEVLKGKARLLSVAERGRFLFEHSPNEGGSGKGRRKPKQEELFDDLLDSQRGDYTRTEQVRLNGSATTLDRVHQAMLLFAAGRSEALRRFLVDDGIGRDHRFWLLAQALVALYPNDSVDRRWAEGLMAKKKGFGL